MEEHAVFTHIGSFGVLLFYCKKEQGWLRIVGWVRSYSPEYSVIFSFRANESEFSVHGVCEESC